MTKQMKAAAAMLLLSGLSVHAQLTTTTQTKNVALDETRTTIIMKEKKPVRKAARKPVTRKEEQESMLAKEIHDLREKQAAQQVQIDALTQANAAKDAALQQANTAATQAQSTAATATAQAQTVTMTVQQNATEVETLKSNVADLQTTSSGLASTISANKVEINEKVDSPTTLHYKGVTITPVAFFALEGVYRERSVNSDINTPFNTIPYMGANEAHVSELNFSGRQSRIGGLFEGKASSFKLAGYIEADFLGAGTTSNGNQSNSFVLRQRQFWGQIATNKGFTFTGGQMWSLVTETGKSTDNRTEKLPNTVDPQYMVGFNWARQPAIRIQQKFASTDEKRAFTVAISLEEAQLTNTTSTLASTDSFFNGPGQNGGLFNAYNGTPTNNIAPDVFLKFAADLTKAHFELGGVARFFRARVYPALANAPAGYVAVAGAAPYNNTALAGGVFASARVTTSKYADAALQVMAGDGVGRYGSAQLADATLHREGTLEPIRNYHALFSLETHPTSKLDVYGYAGGEYAQRTVYATGVASSPFTGYGPVTNNLIGCNTEVSAAAGSVTPVGVCNAATRDILEGMAGFTYRIASSQRFGRLQYQFNYQYLTKTAWLGAYAGTVSTTTTTTVPTPTAYGAPKATNGMVFFGMRYYIP